METNIFVLVDKFLRARMTRSKKYTLPYLVTVSIWHAITSTKTPLCLQMHSALLIKKRKHQRRCTCTDELGVANLDTAYIVTEITLHFLIPDKITQTG